MDEAQPQVKADYSEIGAVLRHAREQMRLPIDQAARLLHIRMRYLEAMEEGLIAELPGLPYVRGYIQTYASFLGLDKEEMIRRFDAVGTTGSSSLYYPQVLSKEKTATPYMIWVGIGGAFALYVLWALLAIPSETKVSVVDAAPHKTLLQVSAELAANVACLKPQEGLYPPCIVVKEPEFRAPPLNKKLRSVMDMAVLPLDIPAEPATPAKETRETEPDEENTDEEE